MALLVLPGSQVYAKSLMNEVIERKIFHFIFWEHPAWFQSDNLNYRLFLRASFQATYNEYYNVFHDDTTKFDYYEYDEKPKFPDKTWAVEPVTNREVIQPFIRIRNEWCKKVEPDEGTAPRVVSMYSKFLWLAASSYFDCDVPEFMPVTRPDIKASVKRFFAKNDHKNSKKMPLEISWYFNTSLVDPVSFHKQLL